MEALARNGETPQIIQLFEAAKVPVMFRITILHDGRRLLALFLRHVSWLIDWKMWISVKTLVR
jgi:hypothetical protein